MHPEITRALAQAKIDGMLADAAAYRLTHDAHRPSRRSALGRQLTAARRRLRGRAAGPAPVARAKPVDPCPTGR